MPSPQFLTSLRELLELFLIVVQQLDQVHSGVRDDLADARELVLEPYVDAGEGTVLRALELAVLLQEGSVAELALAPVFLKLAALLIPSLSAAIKWVDGNVHFTN